MAELWPPVILLAVTGLVILNLVGKVAAKSVMLSQGKQVWINGREAPQWRVSTFLP
jgi:hypothetical protein